MTEERVGASVADADRRDRARARLGVSLFFFLNGFLAAGLLSRLPEVKDLLGLTTVGFGFIVAALPLGSIAAAALPAPLIRRFGAARVASVGTVVMAGVFALAGATTSAGGAGGNAMSTASTWAVAAPWVVAGLIALAGFLDAIVDAAQNVHGLVVEQQRDTSIFNSLHAIWSVGGVAGGGLGLVASALRIPLGAHLAVTGLLGIALAIWAWTLSKKAELRYRTRVVLSEEPAAESTAEAAAESPAQMAAEMPATDAGDSAAGPSKWVLLVGIIALGLLGAFIEDLGMNWSALYFSQVAGVGVELAGIAFIVALTGQLIARFMADAATDRVGRSGVVFSGGALVTVGMLLAMTVAAPWAVIVGFFLSGFGSATFIPSAYAAAGSLPGFSHGMGITLTSWALRIAMLGSSPLLGLTANLLGLRYALVITVIAGLGAMTLAFTPVLRRSAGTRRGQRVRGSSRAQPMR